MQEVSVMKPDYMMSLLGVHKKVSLGLFCCGKEDMYDEVRLGLSLVVVFLGFVPSKAVVEKVQSNGSCCREEGPTNWGSTSVMLQGRRSNQLGFDFNNVAGTKVQPVGV